MLDIILKNKVYIIMLDGGICSQMNQYIMGQYLAAKGYEVKYDISWYKKGGMDKINKFVRNFDLLKLYPELNIKFANKLELIIYRKFYYYELDWRNKKNDLDLIEAERAYLGGYYSCDESKRLELFKSHFVEYKHTDFLDPINKRILSEIKECNRSLGVHVRRGDYGDRNPILDEYFINAIRENFMNYTIFFFSDEPDWVERQLIPQLDNIEDYKIVDVNGSDKGYIDLYLLSYCKNIISSQGSLGVTAARMNQVDKLVVIEDNANVKVFAYEIEVRDRAGKMLMIKE